MKLFPLALIVLLATLPVGPAASQQCDDFDSCTSNDMCSEEGECSGSPANGGSCDDSNECTTNDSCASGTCTGSPAPMGTVCNGGCGTCLSGFCLPDLPKNGQPCTDVFSCTINDVCMFGFCFGTLRTCPDADGNPCTADFCNPENGQCQTFDVPPCAPCQTCRAGSGTFSCEAGPNGGACDDFNECTDSSMCFDGTCVEGVPSGPTPTATLAPPTATATLVVPTATAVVPTATAVAPTATSAVPTSTPGGTACIGDCGDDGQVSVDEIIRAVNIALGSLTVDDCPAADGNGDRQVTVDEIVAAVNNALNGCP